MSDLRPPCKGDLVIYDLRSIRLRSGQVFDCRLVIYLHFLCTSEVLRNKMGSVKEIMLAGEILKDRVLLAPEPTAFESA